MRVGKGGGERHRAVLGRHSVEPRPPLLRLSPGRSDPAGRGRKKKGERGRKGEKEGKERKKEGKGKEGGNEGEKRKRGEGKGIKGEERQRRGEGRGSFSAGLSSSSARG